MNQRLERAVSACETLGSSIIEVFVDLGLSHLADTHHKVSMAALSLLMSLHSQSQFNKQCKPKLGTVTTALFNRLIDRRPNVRDQANSILNEIRYNFDPVDLIAAV